MPRLYLVRHAIHGLVGKALAGRMPRIFLSDEGRRQAEALSHHFARLSVGEVQSSPLERCRQTAAPIAARLGLAETVSAALNELDCGEWTGQTFDVLSNDTGWVQWNAERGRTVVPGGESIGSVRDRVMALVETLQVEEREPAIFVTHSDVIKVVLLTLLGVSLDLHDRLEIDPASITTLDLWRGGGKIVRSNETAAA